MNCARARKALSRRLDGELEPALRARLDEHLAGCAACRETDAAWREAGRLLREEPVRAPPAEVMWADVRRAIRQLPAREETPVPFIGWRLHGAAAIVGALFVMVAAVGLLRLSRGTTEISAQAAPAVEWVESDVADASTMVYEDAEDGVVVIWLMTAEHGGEAPKGS